MVTEFQLIVVDKSRLPIVVIKVKDYVPSIRDYGMFFDSLSSLLELESETYWVFDAQSTWLTSAETRTMLTTWIAREEKRIKAKVKGIFLINASFWKSMQIKAAFVFDKLPVQTQVVNALEDVENIVYKGALATVPA